MLLDVYNVSHTQTEHSSYFSFLHSNSPILQRHRAYSTIVDLTYSQPPSSALYCLLRYWRGSSQLYVNSGTAEL